MYISREAVDAKWKEKALLVGWIVSPKNSPVEALSPSTSDIIVFGDRAFKEVIKLKWGS